MAKKNKKNSDASGNKNYYLLFKQGLKSVFTSKIQFIVIFLLSIFAISLLTSGMTSFNRVSSNQEEIFSSTKQFDYDFHYDINDPENSISYGDDIHPLLDLEYAYSSSIGGNQTNNSYNLYYAGTNANGTLFDGIFQGSNLDTYADEFNTGDDNSFVSRLENQLYINLVSAVTTNQVGGFGSGPNDSPKHDITELTTESLIYNYFKDAYSANKTDIHDYPFLEPYLNFEARTLYTWMNSVNHAYNHNSVISRKEFFTRNIIGDISNQNDKDYRYFTNQITPFSNDPQSDEWYGWAGDLAWQTDGSYKTVPNIEIEINDNLSIKNFLTKTPPINSLYACHGSVSQTYLSAEQYVPTVLNGGSISICKPYSFGNNQIDDNQPDAENWFYLHTKMAAEETGFDVDFRNEIYVNDYSNNIKYRAVALDQDGSINNYNDPNIQIYKGSMPQNPIQIVVSPQFAKSNNWDVGDWISINEHPFQISGIGVDPYSFVPTADNNEILPDINSSGVLYIPQSSIRSITNYNAKSSVSSIQQTHAFLTSKNGDGGNINDFNRYLGNNGNIDSLTNVLSNDYSTGLGLSEQIAPFSNSSYSKNWTFFSSTLSAFKMIVYISSIIVLIISLISCYVSIKKNIERNSSQIAILKAMGTSNNLIAFAYLSYAFIITFVAIPIGWMIGVILQFPLCGFFNQFFSLDYSRFNVDFWPLLISFVLVGLVSFLCSYFSALIILNKPVIEVIVSKEKWSQNKFVEKWGAKIFGQKSFNTNMRVKLVSSSTKNIWLLFIIIFISSFLMTIVLSIPSIITNISDVFFHDLNYKNEYTLNSPIYNSPLSKYQTNFVSPINDLEKDYNSQYGYQYLDSNGQLQYSGGYKELSEYFDTTGSTSPIPYFIFDDSENANWIADSLRNNRNLTFEYIIDFFGNNFYSGIGPAFSSSSIDGILETIYEMNVSIRMNEGLTQEQAESESISIVSTINDGMSKGILQILNQIFGSGGIPDDTSDWRQAVTDMILQQLPPFVQQYVYESDSRTESYPFGWGFYNSEISNDSLVTQYDSVFDNIDNNNSISTIGLSKTNPIISLSSSEQNQLRIDDESLDELSQVTSGNYTSDNYNGGDIITDSGFKVYDSNSKTILIPTIASQQALVDLNKSTDYNGLIDDDFAVSGRQELQYKNSKTNDYTTVNKSDWVYDDTDFYKSNYYQSLNPDQQQAYSDSTLNHVESDGSSDHAYLNPYSLSNTAFSYKDEYDSNDKIEDKSFARLELYGSNSNKSAVVRPYYEFKNIQLFLPNAVESAVNLSPQFNTSETTDYTKVVSVVQAGEVPDFIKINSPDSEWNKISPYDLNFSDYYTGSDSSISNFFNSPTNWYTSVLYECVGEDTGDWQVVNNTNPTIFSDQGIAVKYDVLDTADIYGSSNFYIGDDYANLIYGYDTTNYSQIMPTLNSESLNIGYDTDPTTPPDFSDFTNEISSQYTYLKFDGTETNFWYNTSYSNTTEPIGFSSQANFAPNLKFGVNGPTAANSSFNSVNTCILDTDLLSTKEIFVSEITNLFVMLTSFFIIFIVICSALLILLISNLFISRYYLFMNQMKAEGYSKKRILNLTLNNFTPFVLLSWALAFGLAIGFLYLVNFLIFTSSGIILPFGFDWYNGFIVLFMVGIIYGCAFLMAYIKLRRNPAELLTS